MKILKINNSTKDSFCEYIVLKHRGMATKLVPSKEINSLDEAIKIGAIMAKNAAKKLKLNLDIE